MGVQFLDIAEFRKFLAQGGAARIDRRADPLDPDRDQRRLRPGDIPDSRPRRRRFRRPGRGGDIVRARQGAVHRGDCRRRRGAGHQHGPCFLRRRQNLYRHLGHHAKRSPRTGHQLAQVVACHVLHHAAAGFEQFAAPRHGLYTEEMIAGRPRLDPPRPRKIAGQDTADGAEPCGLSQQRSVIRRFERQHLAVLVELHPDLFHRRAGPGAHHQFIRLVKRHTCKGCRAQHVIRRYRPAEGAPRPATGYFKRRLAGQGIGDDGARFFGGCRIELVGHRRGQNRGISGKRVWPL